MMDSKEDARVDEAVLALLFLNHDKTGTAWKSLDWDSLERLHEAGWISNPRSKNKSVQFSVEGLERARQAYEHLVGRS